MTAPPPRRSPRRRPAELAKRACLAAAALLLSACPEDDDERYRRELQAAEEEWSSYETHGPLVVELATPEEPSRAPRFRVRDDRNPDCPGVWSIAVKGFDDIKPNYGGDSRRPQPYRWYALEAEGDGAPVAASKRCFTEFTYGVAPAPLTTVGEIRGLAGPDGRFVVYVQGPTYPDGGVAEGLFRFRVEGGRLVPD